MHRKQCPWRCRDKCSEEALFGITIFLEQAGDSAYGTTYTRHTRQSQQERNDVQSPISPFLSENPKYYYHKVTSISKEEDVVFCVCSAKLLLTS